MKLEGEILVEAPRERVWQMLNDREVLKRHMPGCEALNEVGDEKYEAVISIGIGAIKGSYEAKFEIAEKKPPESYTLRIEGSGRPGFVKGEGQVFLEDQGEKTLLKYSGEIHVGGVIARIGQRLIGGIATKMTQQFFLDMAEEASSEE